MGQIIVNLDVELAKRKMSLSEFSPLSRPSVASLVASQGIFWNTETSNHLM